MYVMYHLKRFYEDKHNFQVVFVGHPSIDAINDQPEIDQSNLDLKMV
jgi:lipid A disaccharide synthetase